MFTLTIFNIYKIQLVINVDERNHTRNSTAHFDTASHTVIGKYFMYESNSYGDMNSSFGFSKQYCWS